MKCRIPPQKRLNKTQKSACREYIAEREKNSVRRLFKLFCWALNKDFGFGKQRLLKLIGSVSELSQQHSTDEVFWEHCDRYLNSIGLPFENEEYEDILNTGNNLPQTAEVNE